MGIALHLNSDYSDLEITCGGKSFPAHRLVVCPRSEYFKRACNGNLKAPVIHPLIARWTEIVTPLWDQGAEESIINLNDKSPVLVEKVLEFLYTGNYTIGHHTLEEEDPKFDGDGGLEKDTEHAGESSINDTSGEHASEIHDISNEHGLENTALGFVDGTSPNEKRTLIDELF
ncbi:hypothetical protein ETB97_006724 [Aspergillus alliaceus]|uniref:BTB domain-containing protein n=1 Tax=Petromyces alliaceus TaxID=209559 RepID=A0A8H5ZUY8_PETAA|nr:hypothetical protein ETB97_006724 [Aspergillus burnettii]